MLKLSIALLAIVAAVHSAPTVDSSLLRSLQAPGSTANIRLSMKTGTTREALNTLKHATFATRGERLNAVHNVLKAQADRVQADLLTFLAKEKSPSTMVRQMWISNAIIIRKADLQLVEKLMARSDVAEIQQERFLPLEQPITNPNAPAPRAGEQWGVVTIEAPAVWEAGYEGQGIVVANVDTGVRGTHEALRGNHREQNGWYDPEDLTATPNDGGGHGTHTMGTIAGQTNGIGVAPKATWIACKGCGDFGCSYFALEECGNYIACPTDNQGNNPNCELAPHLVSNSWGGGQGDSFYDDVIDAWRAGGIVPLFSIGNSGTSCNTANSPGDNINVIGVGATDSSDYLSYFSSVGPSVNGDQKPDIAAPGSDVYSSYNTADNSYTTMSGTSMACPHAAGLVALLLSRDQTLTYDQVKVILESGAVPHTSEGRTCGGTSESEIPNYHSGYGRVSAVNSVLGKH